MTRLLAVFLVCANAAFAMMTAGTPALAQQPAIPPECVAEADTVPSDSLQVRRDIHGRAALGFFTMFTAPSLLLPFVDPCDRIDEPELGFWRNHASIAATLSGMSDGSRSGVGLRAEFEVLLRGFYGEARLERYPTFADLPETVWLRSARVGYLVHPARYVAGGATVGYRTARGAPDEWATTGVEIGLPIVVSVPRHGRWIWWETSYLITAERVVPGFRVRGDFPLGRTPFVAGVSMELRGLREKNPFALLGTMRLRP